MIAPRHIKACRRGHPRLACRRSAREFTEWSDESRCMGPFRRGCCEHLQVQEFTCPPAHIATQMVRLKFLREWSGLTHWGSRHAGFRSDRAKCIGEVAHMSFPTASPAGTELNANPSSCEYFYCDQEIAVKKELLMAAIAAATLVGTAAGAAEFPSFEPAGFPITRHQVAVMGAANISERSPVPTLVYGGMPASPHQIAVLTPRPGMMAEARDAKPTVGFVSK